MDIVASAKDIFSSNGGKVAIAIGGGIILYTAIKAIQDNAGLTVVAPTGYTSYPDADKNANVIIDQVNQHTTYENELTRDEIADMGNYLTGRFDSTDGYIKDGFENLNSNLDKWGTNINSNLDNWGGTINGNINSWGGSIMGGIGDVSNKIDSGFSGINDTLSSIKDNVYTNGGGVAIPGNPVLDGSHIPPDPNHVPDDLVDVDAGFINTSSQIKNTSNSEYYKKFQYGDGSTWNPVSIVDGMKSIGIFSNDGYRMGDYRAMKNIAEANGIKNYTGTASQNTKLVELGTKGKLKKPTT